MLAISDYPLSKEDEKEIRDWLQHPACKKVQALLCANAARGLADAANILARLEPGDNEDPVLKEAKYVASMARMHRDFAIALSTLSSRDLRMSKFEPMPLTITPPSNEKP